MTFLFRSRAVLSLHRQMLSLAMLSCLGVATLLPGLVHAQRAAAELTETQRALLVLNRLAYGPRPGDLAEVEKTGVNRWIEQQLSPGSIPMPPALAASVSANPALTLSEAELFMQYGPPAYRTQKVASQIVQDQTRNKAHEQALRQFISLSAWQGRLQLATSSPRQLQEVMTEFWFNHFNVFEGKGLDGIWIGEYENQVIRPRALGTFRELLGAAAHSGAMLFYLDNWQSSGTDSVGAKGKFKGLNENYGRELLELHTMGVGSGYTQQDVIVLAKALSGWTIGRRDFRRDDLLPAFKFDASRHDNSSKTLLGVTLTGQGEKEGMQALDLIARQPATAHFLAKKMVSYFVSGDPDAWLVSQVATTYQQTGGDIRSMLKTIFASPLFWQKANYQTQFKTPYQYVVSALRATGTEVLNPRPVQQALRQMGQPVYGWQTPEGYSFTPGAWMTGEALAKRIDVAEMMASGRHRISAPAPLLADGTERPAPPVQSATDARATPASADQLLQTLAPMWSDQTLAAVAQARGPQKAALLLGSPDFMKR